MAPEPKFGQHSQGGFSRGEVAQGKFSQSKFSQGKFMSGSAPAQWIAAVGPALAGFARPIMDKMPRPAAPLSGSLIGRTGEAGPGRGLLPFTLPGPGQIVRDTMGLPATLGRLGSLEVRLATTRKEIRRAQKLRFKVFYEEMSAVPHPTALLTRRDKDAFDYVCDHLLVIDHEWKTKFGRVKPKVVGTYRVLRQDVADRNFGFYSAAEYGIEQVIAANPSLRFMELGRSCVLKPYRTKRTVELLWHGLWAYVLHHRIDVMLGCASLEGTDPDALGLELSFLHHFARTPDAWRVRALDERYVPMDRMPKDAINPKAALQALPPLIKGYLRLGATFGDGAVIDRQFGTTDVFVMLRVADIDKRYIAYYGADASRYAA
jgi:putative hemolysin